MGCYLDNPWGDSVTDPTPDQMREWLERVDPEDEEHGAAWLTDDAGRTLEWNGNGVLVFARDGAESRHMTNVSVDEALVFWVWLAEQRLDELRAAPWNPGPRPPMSEEERAQRLREYANWQLEQDREFYDMLGDERENVRCRRSDCERGAIEHSVLCRRHHFESIRGRRCPFEN